VTVRRRATGAGRFTAICSVLLLVDFVVGVIAWGRCVNAGEGPNSGVDGLIVGVAFYSAVALVALILGGAAVSTAQWVREIRRRRKAAQGH